MNKYGFLHITLSENNVVKDYEWFYQEYIILVMYTWFYIADVRISTAACVCVSVYSVSSDFIIPLLDIERQTRPVCYTWVKTQAIVSQHSVRKQIVNIMRPAMRQSLM